MPVSTSNSTLAVPPPPEGVAEWPVVGEKLSIAWGQASDNLQNFLVKYKGQLQPIGAWVVSQAASAGAAALLFFLAIIIAGLLMAKADAAVSATTAVAARLAGEEGAAMVNTAGATIRSVVQGVLGVAVIQSLAAGIGMLVVGVPGAGLWAGKVDSRGRLQQRDGGVGYTRSVMLQVAFQNINTGS